jgi:uncharacterized protein (TIGR02246 family)
MQINDNKTRIEEIYHKLLSAWNERNARSTADLFTEDGEIIGFDGSISRGPDEIFSHLNPIFQHHPTAAFVGKVKEVQFLDSNAAFLRAIAGMIPQGKKELNPSVNTHHTLLAVLQEDEWHIKLYQNTPAQFHGRPEMVKQMTQELREYINEFQ